MSENEMIWRATDADGRCWLYGEKPDWSEHQFYSQDGRVLEYYGTEKPPPGECWEIVQMRKGDIDTDGEPIGWKIVGIGKDGSVLCEKPNGQRRRYSFGDGANGKPSGEAWERLVEAVADYAINVGVPGPRGKTIREAWKAYEADKPAEPTAQQATIERLTKERDEALRELANERSISDQVIDERNATIAELRSELDETRTERHAYKSRLREFCQRLVDMVGAEGPEDVQVMLDKVNAELHRLKQNIDSMSANLADKEGFLNSAGDEIERLTKERDEAKAEAMKWRRELDAAVEHHSRWTGALIKALPEYARFSGDLLHNVLCAIEAIKNELANERARSGQVTTEQINVIAELQAKLARPEMPECVRTMLSYGTGIIGLPGWCELRQQVIDHYAPPFKITGPGVYEDRGGNVWNVVWKDKSDKHFQWLGECDGDTGWFSDSGQGSDETQLTKFLRPLEG